MSSPPARVDIAVLAKAPIAGFAKTRLISALGPAGAARLHRRLAARTVVTAVSAALGQVTIWAAPDTSHRFFRALSWRYGVKARSQPSGDLGRRMLAAFAHEPEGTLLLVIGTDCPPLTASHLHAAADALRAGHDATFLAAEDGGYVLIGLRRAIPELFRDIAWGTDRVMAQTRGRMRELGLKWHEGEVLWDVDRPEDLHRLAALEISGQGCEREPVSPQASTIGCAIAPS
jgi:rSAM/selenodomain-associated transferase 1